MPSPAEVQDGIFAIVRDAHPTKQAHEDVKAKFKWPIDLQRVGSNMFAMSKRGRLKLEDGYIRPPYIKRYGLP